MEMAFETEAVVGKNDLHQCAEANEDVASLGGRKRRPFARAYYDD
jgi:hypothetical protein